LSDRVICGASMTCVFLCVQVQELGGVPALLSPGDMVNTIPDEKVTVTFLVHLCARLMDIRRESRAARVIQTAWRAHHLRHAEHLYKVGLKLLAARFTDMNN